MAIDTIIGYDCVPKQTFGDAEIVERLKGKGRAETIIRIYREQGDNRAPSEMGFEVTRTTADGENDSAVFQVQALLDAAAELDAVSPYCAGCPANVLGKPFGCMGAISYPLSAAGETWLLKQLPDVDEPLVWLLLRQGVEQFAYDGAEMARLRGASDVYFQDQQGFARPLGEFVLTSNQTFEMLFLVGDLQPNHAGVLLLFFNAIRRDMEADAIMRITPAPDDAAERYPFLHRSQEADDLTVAELKQFLYALYTAWRLNVALKMDV